MASKAAVPKLGETHLVMGWVKEISSKHGRAGPDAAKQPLLDHHNGHNGTHRSHPQGEGEGRFIRDDTGDHRTQIFGGIGFCRPSQTRYSAATQETTHGN